MSDRLSEGQPSRLLRGAARACGIAASYIDYQGNRVGARPSALARMINALQKDDLLPEQPGDDDLRGLIQTLRDDKCARALPSVLVAWDGAFPDPWIWLPPDETAVTVTIQPEDGEPIRWTHEIGAADAIRRKGLWHVRSRLRHDVKLPHGYYRLSVDASGRQVSTFLISAPRSLPGGDRQWGAFAPAYALRTGTEQGIGGYKELLDAASVIRDKGGAFLGTLPMLATIYQGEHANRSPYSPSSRLFWNEIFLDVTDLPGQEHAPETDFAALNSAELVDYPAVHAAKMEIIARSAQAFFARHPDGDDDYRAYLQSVPHLPAYAGFMAELTGGGDDTVRTHLYAQYACHIQLSRFKAMAEQDRAAQLYLDYPIGIHAAGFDARQFGHLFLSGYFVGAPPDLMFRKGQNWEFRPFDPRAFEQDRFAYFRATIHHYFRYARMLRLDHIMGFYRIFCIPEGADGHEGVYIHYPFDAFVAVLCLEAERHDGVMIGEDLGTVPDAVRHAMEKHNFNRMWLFQFDLKKEPSRTFNGIGRSMIAGFNTHDMFPFAAFQTGADLKTLHRLKLMSMPEMVKMGSERRKLLRDWSVGGQAYLTALEGMARSSARFVIVNMEDFWGEAAPQNIPGTMDEYPNWRKKFTRRTETWSSVALFANAVNLLNRYRKR